MIDAGSRYIVYAVSFFSVSYSFRGDDCVIVLQTEAASIEVPYITEEGWMHVDARVTTHLIMAGLASAIAGVRSPVMRYSPSHERTTLDLVWAFGYFVCHVNSCCDLSVNIHFLHSLAHLYYHV